MGQRSGSLTTRMRAFLFLWCSIRKRTWCDLQLFGPTNGVQTWRRSESFPRSWLRRRAERAHYWRQTTIRGEMSA
jgi:hypothetical protein